jgi:isochorismate hydrolase
MTDRQRGLLKYFWGAGMRSQETDREVVQELVPGTDDRIFTKWRYSAFFNSGLLSFLRGARRDQLVLCGVYAHVGLLSTAQDAFANDIQPFLVADACGDFSETYHRLALTYVAQRCGQVVTSEEVFR